MSFRRKNQPKVDETAATAEELLTYRVENKVKERIESWGKRQLSIIVVGINVLLFLGVGTVAYTAFNTIIDREVTKQVSQAIGREKETVDRDMSELRNYIDNESKDIEEARKSVQNALDEYAEKARRVDKLVDAMENDADVAHRKIISLQEALRDAVYEQNSLRMDQEIIKDNLRGFGESIYAKADAAVDVLMDSIIAVRASESVLREFDAIAETGSITDAFRREVERYRGMIEKRHGVRVDFLLQAGMGLHKDLERWMLELRIAGFEVEGFSSGTTVRESTIDGADDYYHGIKAVASAYNRCVISSPNRRLHANEVQEMLASLGLYSECGVVVRDIRSVYADGKGDDLLVDKSFDGIVVLILEEN